MPCLTRAVVFSALLAAVNAQGFIVSAKGDKGQSLALQLNNTNSNDANIINDKEIGANLVNECGRTLLLGNIDIGQNTEDALAANQVTQVKKSSKVAVTINQVNEQGAGPFTCDMDQTSNANGLTGQTKLQVQQGNANGRNNGNLELSVTMPADMQCIGGSTGNICTVRCRNAQNFGGCFAVQQTDVTPNKNTADNIETNQDLAGILAKTLQNLKDFPSVNAASNAAPDEAAQGLSVANALLKNNPDVAQTSISKNANGNSGKSSKSTKNSKGNQRRGESTMRWAKRSIV